jgi:hypothetical protein
MNCPKCGSNNTKPIDDHYFCNVCFAEFSLKTDAKKYFPFNCIFPNRALSLFYRKPYYDFNKSE